MWRYFIGQIHPAIQSIEEKSEEQSTASLQVTCNANSGAISKEEDGGTWRRQCFAHLLPGVELQCGEANILDLLFGGSKEQVPVWFSRQSNLRKPEEDVQQANLAQRTYIHKDT